jgi:hypothetical protein
VTDQKRLRLTLSTTTNGQVTLGDWFSLETAERKFRSWIGSYGSMPGARIMLAEQAADETWIELRAWLDEKV